MWTIVKHEHRARLFIFKNEKRKKKLFFSSFVHHKYKRIILNSSEKEKIINFVRFIFFYLLWFVIVLIRFRGKKQRSVAQFIVIDNVMYFMNAETYSTCARFNIFGVVFFSTFIFTWITSRFIVIYLNVSTTPVSFWCAVCSKFLVPSLSNALRQMNIFNFDDFYDSVH